MAIHPAACLALLASAIAAAQPLPSDWSITAAAVDPSGSIYLAGFIANADLPTTPGVFEPAAPHNNCTPVNCPPAFIAKLPPTGDRLLWASYLQSDGKDTITALAVDSEGRVFVAGSTTSTGLLYHPGPYFPAALSTESRHPVPL